MLKAKKEETKKIFFKNSLAKGIDRDLINLCECKKD